MLIEGGISKLVLCWSGLSQHLSCVDEGYLITCVGGVRGDHLKACHVLVGSSQRPCVGWDHLKAYLVLVGSSQSLSCLGVDRLKACLFLVGIVSKPSFVGGIISKPVLCWWDRLKACFLLVGSSQSLSCVRGDRLKA